MKLACEGTDENGKLDKAFIIGNEKSDTQMSLFLLVAGTRLELVTFGL
jgi:hypothetical protein